MGRPRTNPVAEMLIANDSGVIDLDGVPYNITRGVTRLRADHPLVRAAEHLFDPIDSHYPELEQTTAAPGEKRGE